MPPAEPAWLIPGERGGATWRRDQAGKPEGELSASQPLHGTWTRTGQKVAHSVLTKDRNV